jgi:hypothetical protein
MQHLGQNKELLVYKQISFALPQKQKMAHSKFLGVNDKTLHESIEEISQKISKVRGKKKWWSHF